MPAKKKSSGSGKKTAKGRSSGMKSVNISFSEDLCKDIEKKSKSCCTSKAQQHACGGFAYFLAFIGAAVYYISTATGFWNGVWGVIKALLWPAFLVFELLKFLNM
ncbi:hypothetical protein KY362_02175 [Candidatus Woesearchaeota archaeon]|nr:hypothetical protein [Candidatus Woesearchaeota archaeon]